MEELYIYVLELVNEKYFIHHANQKNDEIILFEFEIYFDYLKIYKPLRISEIIKEEDELHLDNVVKNYMYKHGYENVRGGSYSEVELSKATQHFIERELTESIREYPNKHTYSYEYLVNNYIMRDWNRLEEIDIEHNKIKSEFQQYQQNKILLESVKKCGKQIINEYFSQQIKELYSYCKNRCYLSCGETYEREHAFYLKYKGILPCIQHVLNIYMEKCEFPCQKFVNYMHKYPHFYLDPLFYSYSFSYIPTNIIENIDEIFEAINYFTNWVICYIQELSFINNSYGYDIEWLYPRILYILEKIKNVELMEIKIIKENLLLKTMVLDLEQMEVD